MIIGLDNGLAPDRRQAIILTNDEHSHPKERHFNEKIIEIKQFSMAELPLTHLSLVPHKGVSESGQHWFR